MLPRLTDVQVARRAARHDPGRVVASDRATVSVMRVGDYTRPVTGASVAAGREVAPAVGMGAAAVGVAGQDERPNLSPSTRRAAGPALAGHNSTSSATIRTATRAQTNTSSSFTAPLFHVKHGAARHRTGLTGSG
jgi:hypothetical protein